MTRKVVTTSGFLLVAGAALIFSYTPLATYLDSQLLDRQFRFLRAVALKHTPSDVIIVGIDEETFKTFPEPLALWHTHLGKLLEALTLAPPRAAALDVVLPDRSYDFLVPGHDRPLLEGLLRLRKVAPVFLAQTIDEKARLRPLFAPIVAIVGQQQIGLILVKPDSDGSIRRYESEIRTEKGVFPTLLGRMAKRLGAQGTEGMIDYSLGRPFNYVPLQQVTTWLDESNRAALQGTFAGKVVLLGSVLPFVDRHLVPVPLAVWETQNRQVPGVLVHAQALRTLLHGSSIHPALPSFVIGLTLLATLLWWLGHKPLWGVALLILVFGLSWGISTRLLLSGIFLPLSGILFASFLGLIGRVGLEGIFVVREKRRLRASFGRYVSPQVLNDILRGRLKPGIGGSRRRVCVLFSDIRGFTKLSEGQDPQAIVEFLNRYFNEMTETVHQHGGTIDKFIGDGLMAFFGAPNDRLNPAQDALDAAQTMIRRLTGLNASLEAEGSKPIAIGVGLHLGEVVVGHVGSEARHEYTAIGDAVNVASRLEGITKQVGYPIVCSETVRQAVTEEGLDDLGPQAIKGHTPVTAYGWKPG